MSSTGRGGQRSEADNYPTPAWCVKRLLEACSLPGGVWLEPACGDGAIINAVDSHLRLDRRPPVTWHANDIRAPQKILTVEKLTGSDFLSWSWTVNGPRDYSVCITNPPYSLAQDFIEQALSFADVAVMLLRLNYLGSENRAAFWHAHAPDVYVLPNRPAFVNGKTDSCEYAWFVWQRGLRRTSGSIRVLATTPKSERCAKEARS